MHAQQELSGPDILLSLTSQVSLTLVTLSPSDCFFVCLGFVVVIVLFAFHIPTNHRAFAHTIF